MQHTDFSLFSELTTKRLSLRFVTLNDTKPIFALRSNKEINKYITRHIPSDISEAEEFVNKISKNIIKKKNLFWVILLKGTSQIIGTIGYHNFSQDYKYAEIGYELHPIFHKKGLMSEALTKILDIGLSKLNFETIEAFTHKRNQASKVLLNKHNFIFQPNRIDVGFENNAIFQLTNK